jgi:hypothetical protein
VLSESEQKHCIQSSNRDTTRPRFYWRMIDDGLLVVDLDRFDFTLLNGSAALAWLELSSTSYQPDALASEIERLLDRPVLSLRNDFDSLLETWRDLGWLSSSDDGRVFIASHTSSPTPQPYRVISAERLALAASETRLEWECNMDFIGKPVSVRILSDPSCLDSDVLMRARSFLAGLPASTGPADDLIEMFVARTGLFLRLGSTCVEANDVSDALSRLILWCFYIAYGEDEFLGTFHAAAIGREEGAIIMPGLSGAGKSTLTAFLCAHGWRYGGDDIVGLSRPSGESRLPLVLPFCSAISVKDGAIPVLEPHYPGLSALPTIAYDTKRARFPAVPIKWQMGPGVGPRRIRAIVFPRYKAGASLDMTTLDLRETLLELVGIGYRTGERMDAELLDGVFDFLEYTPSYKFTYGNPCDADHALRSLL